MCLNIHFIKVPGRTFIAFFFWFLLVREHQIRNQCDSNDQRKSFLHLSRRPLLLLLQKQWTGPPLSDSKTNHPIFNLMQLLGWIRGQIKILYSKECILVLPIFSEKRTELGEIKLHFECTYHFAPFLWRQEHKQYKLPRSTWARKWELRRMSVKVVPQAFCQKKLCSVLDFEWPKMAPQVLQLLLFPH